MTRAGMFVDGKRVADVDLTRTEVTDDGISFVHEVPDEVAFHQTTISMEITGEAASTAFDALTAAFASRGGSG